MRIPNLAVLMVPAGMMLVSPGEGCAQDYPNRPIRMVASVAGASTDFVARVIAPGLSQLLGQQVVVDNRPSGIIQVDVVFRAPPDGYTLLVIGQIFWIGPLMQSTPYDPVKDFLPITLAERGANLVVVHPSLPVKTVKELIALAKAKPGELNYASAASGTGTHLAAELFKAMAGVNIVRVSYKGAGIALNDLLGGQVQLMFPSETSAKPHVKSGRLRALAITSAQPSAMTPELPTVAAAGLPGYESITITGLFAPAKTPAAIINRLNQDIVRVINRGDVKEKFLNAGSEPVGSTPEELAAAVKSDLTRLGKVIKDAGIRAD